MLRKFYLVSLPYFGQLRLCHSPKGNAWQPVSITSLHLWKQNSSTSRTAASSPYLYTNMLLRSQCACARFYDRPTQSNCTVVFLGSIESVELVCKSPFALHASHAALPTRTSVFLTLTSFNQKHHYNATACQTKNSKLDPDTQLLSLMHTQIICFPSFSSPVL